MKIHPTFLLFCALCSVIDAQERGSYVHQEQRRRRTQKKRHSTQELDNKKGSSSSFSQNDMSKTKGSKGSKNSSSKKSKNSSKSQSYIPPSISPTPSPTPLFQDGAIFIILIGGFSFTAVANCETTCLKPHKIHWSLLLVHCSSGAHPGGTHPVVCAFWLRAVSLCCHSSRLMAFDVPII